LGFYKAQVVEITGIGSLDGGGLRRRANHLAADRMLGVWAGLQRAARSGL
jgi:hypothetical protein